MGLPCRRIGGGIELRVRAQPRAAREGIGGCVADAAGEQWLAVRVTAPPDGGRANEAALRLLARRLGVPVSRLVLVAGAASRWKRVSVEGEPEALEARLRELAGLEGEGEKA